MATNPIPDPDTIQPQSPPETPPLPSDPVEPRPDETPAMDPDTIDPGANPDEWPEQV